MKATDGGRAGGTHPQGKECQGFSSSHQRLEKGKKDSPLEPPEEAWLDFGLKASRAVRDLILLF